MTKTTTMGDAFERAGASRAEMIAYAQAAQFIRNGGMREGWIKAFDAAAAKMPGEGQEPSAAEGGRASAADARHPPADGGGHRRLASQGHISDAAPVREPTQGQIAAKAAAARSAARTVLDVYKTHDNVPWGDVGEHELASRTRDGVLSKAIDQYLGPRVGGNRFRPLRDLIKPDQFDLVRARVEHRNDAD